MIVITVLDDDLMSVKDIFAKQHLLKGKDTEGAPVFWFFSPDLFIFMSKSVRLELLCISNVWFLLHR